jgi:hypothetical protein
MVSVRLTDDLASRLRAAARARGLSRKAFAQDALRRAVEAAESGGAPELSGHERLWRMLQANWHAYPAGHRQRVPPELILQMTAQGDEDLLPTLLEECGYYPMSNLASLPGQPARSARETRLVEVIEMMRRLSFAQYYREAPVFTGISDDREAGWFARYYWYLNLINEDDHEDYDDVFPVIEVDFSQASQRLEYWRSLAKELPLDDMMSKDAGWARRQQQAQAR